MEGVSSLHGVALGGALGLQTLPACSPDHGGVRDVAGGGGGSLFSNSHPGRVISALPCLLDSTLPSACFDSSERRTSARSHRQGWPASIPLSSGSTSIHPPDLSEAAGEGMCPGHRRSSGPRWHFALLALPIAMQSLTSVEGEILARGSRVHCSKGACCAWCCMEFVSEGGAWSHDAWRPAFPCPLSSLCPLQVPCSTG
jgi:hypothetical protein